MGFVASNHVWKLDGVTRSTTPDLAMGGLSAGSHALQFSYADFLGRNYSYAGTVRVLNARDYDDQVAAVSAAQVALMQSSILYMANLPLISH